MFCFSGAFLGEPVSKVYYSGREKKHVLDGLPCVVLPARFPSSVKMLCEVPPGSLPWARPHYARMEPPGISETPLRSVPVQRNDVR